MVQSVSTIIAGHLRSSSADDSKGLPQYPQHYLKLCILGAPGVGKSAVVVRYLTRRFIGEYRSEVDITYHHIVTIQNQRTFIEICDFSPKYGEELQVNKVWGDCHLIVFSIADHNSFLNALSIAKSIQESPLHTYTHMTLLGNKLDLDHSRQVSSEEAKKAAQIIPCKYAEVSVAESREDITPIIDELLLRAINQQDGDSRSSCTFFSSLHPSTYISNDAPTIEDEDHVLNNLNSCKSNCNTLPREFSYSKRVKLPKTLSRSISCKPNPHACNKFQDMGQDRHILNVCSDVENKMVNGLIREEKERYMNRNNSIKGRFLSNYKNASNGDVGDKKGNKNESSALSLVFSRGRSNTLNGFGKNGKRPLELRPSIDVFPQEKRTPKTRKPNSKFLALVSPFTNPEPREEPLYPGAPCGLESANGTTCITRMVVQSDKVGHNGLSNEDCCKPPPHKVKTERPYFRSLSPTEEKTQNSNSKRKFGVFGISSLGSVFSKGSLPDLPKATASLYTKIGSIKNTIKKRSV